MNGLQAIQDRILSEAKETASQIASQAEAGSGEILAAARKDCEQMLADARKSAAAQAETVLNRARSAAALLCRKNILQARQDLVDQVLRRSIELLCQMPEQEKTAFYRQLLDQTGAQDGEIVLSAADRHLAADLLADYSGRITLAAEAGTFAGGLVLRRGLIEDNLTFERLAATSRSELVQIAAAALAAATDQTADAS